MVQAESRLNEMIFTCSISELCFSTSWNLSIALHYVEILPIVPEIENDLKVKSWSEMNNKTRHTVQTFSPKHFGRGGEFR